MALRRPRLRILVIGVDSTPDPYAGVGIARSLRQAFPDSELVALDSTPASSGLCWSDFDRAAVLPSRQALGQLCDALRPDEYAIACNDGDIRWLAQRHCGRQVLTPNRSCLRRLRKPARHVARLLGVDVPGSLLVPADARVVARFVAACDAGIWLKGTRSGAERVTPRQARACATRVPAHYQDEWGRALLQAHVPGNASALSFAALRGRLVKSVWIEKLGVTRQGKTWSGRVATPGPGWRPRLSRLVAELDWHGGGDVEFVQDEQSRRWLIDANPRFAAWIHGATLAGTNLPAALVAAASGRRVRPCPATGNTFTRAVVELSVPTSIAPHIVPHVVE